MRNTYYVMRHGQSYANVAHIIQSDPNSGIKKEYGLTSLGKEQVRGAIEKCKAAHELDDQTIIVSSPFLRAVQSAEIANEMLHSRSNLLIDDRIRERWFGEWEEADAAAYEKVWADDKEDPENMRFGVESTHAVEKRVWHLITDLERQYELRTILLVSHGDVIQILLTTASGQSSAMHRDVSHLATAEIRRVAHFPRGDLKTQ